MKLNASLSLAALLVATALPAIGSAQIRHYARRTVGGGYGRGPFYPSWIPGASSNYVGSGVRVYSGPAYYPNSYTYYGYAPYGYYAPTTTYYYSSPRVRFRRSHHWHRR